MGGGGPFGVGVGNQSCVFGRPVPYLVYVEMRAPSRPLRSAIDSLVPKGSFAIRTTSHGS